MIDEKNFLGSKIREIRKKRGLSQAELARAAGVSEISIRKYEANERYPKFPTLKKISNVLDVSYLQLTGEIPDNAHGITIRTKTGKDSFLDTSKMVDAINKNYDLKISSDFIEHCTDMIQARQAKFDLNHPYNRAIQKLKNNEELDSEETQALSNYIQSGEFQRAFDSFSDSMKKLAELLRQNYELLNEEGQKKADKHIEYAADQIELLTKIPEYQKNPK